MLTIYSKDNCPNCEIAHKVALQHGFEVRLEKLTPQSIPAFKEKFPLVKAVPFVLDGEKVIGGLKELKEYCRATS